MIDAIRKNWPTGIIPLAPWHGQAFAAGPMADGRWLTIERKRDGRILIQRRKHQPTGNEPTDFIDVSALLGAKTFDAVSREHGSYGRTEQTRCKVLVGDGICAVLLPHGKDGLMIEPRKKSPVFKDGMAASGKLHIFEDSPAGDRAQRQWFGRAKEASNKADADQAAMMVEHLTEQLAFWQRRLAELRPEIYDLAECRRQMSAHHPDHGGDAEQFMVWQKRYETAKGAAA